VLIFATDEAFVSISLLSTRDTPTGRRGQVRALHQSLLYRVQA